MKVVDFCIETYFQGDEAVRVACSGELDLNTHTRLRDALEVSLQGQPRSLFLDLSQVTFMAAAGIRVVTDTLVESRTRGVELRLSLSPSARRILDLVGLWWIGVVDDGPALLALAKGSPARS
jgi:anti-anti-sigma factor